LNTKFKIVIDVVIDIILLIAVSIVAVKGSFSGIPFFYLLLSRCKNKRQTYTIILVTFISIAMNIIIQEYNTAYIFLLISLYALLGVKYYFIIYKPMKKLKEGNEHLKSLLFRFGPTNKLSDADIKIRFPFMNDFRIQIIRDIYNDVTREEMVYNKKYSVSWVNKNIGVMREEFQKYTDYELSTQQMLIRACIEFGIITVKYYTYDK
jgi:hypothetical protein